jgi:deoxyribose-phosphate aldolase
MNPKARLLAALDHTRLGTDDTDEDIRHFCVDAAAGTARPAAVCVHPQFAGVARRTLDADGAPEIAVAVVTNFPKGGSAAAQPIVEICRAGVAGAAEFDLVFPWRAWLAGNRAAVESLLAACRAASARRCLKVILETGELGEPRLISEAASLALDAGADFIKTSTGRTAVGATPEAARAILETIRDRGHGGFKASGGIRTVADAASYLDLADTILGAGWARPATFRIGASSLLAALRAE